MADPIERADEITGIKGLYNVLGVAGTKAAVMVPEGLPTAYKVPKVKVPKVNEPTKEAKQ